MADGINREVSRAYEQTSFEMVATGAQNKYEVPVSEGAKYQLDQRVTASDFQASLERGDYAFIEPHIEDHYLSSKVLDAETNEFFHVKLRGDVLRVFPKDEEFSKETLARVVEAVEKRVTALEWVNEDG